MKTQPKIELLPISELLPYQKNPRTHPKANVDKLAQSLTEYGWTNPVLVTDKLEVIAGHGRILAAKQLKIATVSPFETLAASISRHFFSVARISDPVILRF